MKKASKILALVTTFLLVSLWVYAAVSKLADFQKFQGQMAIQTLHPVLIWAAIYLLPPVELFAAALLCFERTFFTGLYASAILLCAFSVYIILVLLNFFSRVPCSCGGILQQMSWGTHLVFNLSFLALTLVTIITDRRKEVAGK